MKKTLLIAALLLLFAAPARAAEPAPDMPPLAEALKEFADGPDMMLGDKDVSGHLAEFISGGWGYGRNDVCALRYPGSSEGQLLNVFLSQLQEGIVQYRSTVESPQTNKGAPLRCIKATPKARTMYFDGDRVLEEISFELRCLDAGLMSGLEQSGKRPSELNEEEMKGLLSSMRTPLKTMWFDTTEIILRNAATLWECSPEEARTIVFKHAPGGAEAVRMPDPLQFSVYLAVSPAEFFRRHPALSAQAGLISGGWGYTQAEAMIIGLPAGVKKGEAQEFIPLEGTAFGVRSMLEQSQPLSVRERRYILTHSKDRQELVTPGDGKTYDKLTCTLLMAPQEQRDEYLRLRQAGDLKGVEERVLPKVTALEREIWFDISAPFAHNAGALKALDGKAQ